MRADGAAQLSLFILLCGQCFFGAVQLHLYVIACILFTVDHGNNGKKKKKSAPLVA